MGAEDWSSVTLTAPQPQAPWESVQRPGLWSGAFVSGTWLTSPHGPEAQHLLVVAPTQQGQGNHCRGAGRSLHTAAVVAQDFAFLTEVLGVLLALVRHIQAIRFLQGSLQSGRRSPRVGGGHGEEREAEQVRLRG